MPSNDSTSATNQQHLLLAAAIASAQQHHHHHNSPSSATSASPPQPSSAAVAAATNLLDNESHQLTLLGRSLGPDTVQHFANNQYFCGNRSTAVKILRDILSVVHEFKMLHRVTTWGETSQKRLCIFGILPVVFGGATNTNNGKQTSPLASGGGGENGDPTMTSNSSSSSPLQQHQQQIAGFSFLQPPSKLELGIPIQVWLSVNFPVDPPQLYVVPSPDFGEQLVANHPIVDRSGTIYAPLLASWNPAESTLTPLLKQVQRIFGVIPPLWIDDKPMMTHNTNSSSSLNGSPNTTAAQSNNNNNSTPLEGDGGGDLQNSSSNNNFANFSFTDSNANNSNNNNNANDESSMCVVCLCEEKDTVLVPCGHYVLCSSCATSVQACPICRGQIRLRQRVFL